MPANPATLAELVRDVAQRNGSKPAIIFQDNRDQLRCPRCGDRAGGERLGGARDRAWRPRSNHAPEHPAVHHRLLRRSARRRHGRADQCPLQSGRNCLRPQRQRGDGALRLRRLLSECDGGIAERPVRRRRSSSSARAMLPTARQRGARSPTAPRRNARPSLSHRTTLRRSAIPPARPGALKGAMLTHRNFLANCEQCDRMPRCTRAGRRSHPRRPAALPHLLR